MPYTTDNYIHLPNPDHPESDFRRLGSGNLNIVSTMNFGAGIKARIGILKGTNNSTAVVVYLFDTKKFDMKSAQQWIKNHHKEVKKGMEILNKDFKFTMPLIKDFTGDDGYYYIDLGLSTTVEDLEEDEMTDNALDEMVNELKQVKIVINDSHSHSLKNLIGPTMDAWKADTKLMTRLRVRKKWEDEIKDLIASETPLGGSLEGRATKILPSRDGKRRIDGVKLYGGALTDIPAAWNLRGTVKESKDCPGSLCTQIFKSLHGGEKVEDHDLQKAVTAVHQAAEIDKNENKEKKQLGDENIMKKEVEVDETLLTKIKNLFKADKLSFITEKKAMSTEEESALTDKRRDDDEATYTALDDASMDTNKITKSLDDKSDKQHEDIIKRLDALEQKEYKQEKVIKSLTKENKELKDAKDKEETDKLMKKALTQYKKLNPDKNDVTEEVMMKEIAEDFTDKELEKDFDGCIKTVIKAQKLAMTKIADGKIPQTSDNSFDEMKSDDAKIADNLEKQLKEQGKPVYQNLEEGDD